MWLSRELLGLVTPAVYCTEPWWTQTTTGGDCRTADGQAKSDRSCNTSTHPSGMSLALIQNTILRHPSIKLLSSPGCHFRQLCDPPPLHPPPAFHPAARFSSPESTPLSTKLQKTIDSIGEFPVLTQLHHLTKYFFITMDSSLQILSFSLCTW